MGKSQPAVGPMDSADVPANGCPSRDVSHVIDAARGGCRESFDQLAERCRAYLFHVANRELGDDLQAKCGGSDLVQDTLLQGQQAVGGFRGQTEIELRAWLRQILLHNVARTGRRYRAAAMRDVRRELPLDGPDEGGRIAQELPADLATPSKELMARERITALRQAIERLSAPHRQVVILRNVEHLSFEAIGQAMQRTPQAARKLWARAVVALRHELASSDVSR